MRILLLYLALVIFLPANMLGDPAEQEKYFCGRVNKLLIVDRDSIFTDEGVPGCVIVCSWIVAPDPEWHFVESAVCTTDTNGNYEA